MDAIACYLIREIAYEQGPPLEVVNVMEFALPFPSLPLPLLSPSLLPSPSPPFPLPSFSPSPYPSPSPHQTNESRVVLHFHYIRWPDFGVPQTPDVFLDFLYAVRNSGVLGQDVGPCVVHCSAGIGRSGTFCLVDVCLVKVSCCTSVCAECV